MDTVISQQPIKLAGYSSFPAGTKAPVVSLGPYWSIGFTLSGKAREIRAGDDFFQQRYDFITLRPNRPHGWLVPDDVKEWRVVYFVFSPRPSWLPWLNLPEIRPGYGKISLAKSKIRNKVTETLLEAHKILNSLWPYRYEMAMNAIERALLWVQTENFKTENRVDDRIITAVEFIMKHFAEQIGLDDIMRSSCLCRARFLELFRKHMGISPMKFLEQERMQRGRNLLVMTSRPVKAIAYEIGYKEPAYFTTRFKAHFGQPPRRYRLTSNPG